MDVIPLYLADPPGGPDASHRVCAPGGYEFWLLTAQDDAAMVRLRVGFFDGHPSLHGYLSQYRRYRKRPTANAPPVPRDFPVVEIEAKDPKRRIITDIQQLPAGSLKSSIERLEIFAGDHSLRKRPDGVLELKLKRQYVTADLLFVPDRDQPPASVVSENGQFVYRANPRCYVAGIIKIRQSAEKPASLIEFKGMGSHEHRWLLRRDHY
jgi:hypothetical protein